MDKENGSIIKKELIGGPGGDVKDMDPKGITRIVKIVIHHDNAIQGITVYFKCNGTPQQTDNWGRTAGKRTEINFERNEYITSVKGYIGDHNNHQVVKSLVLETNLDVYGPYGPKSGEPFDLSALDGHIIGFHARAGWHIDAIGIYVKGFIRRRKSLLCGGNGGLPKDIDHTGFPRIVKVSIRHDNAIHALSVCYDLKDGNTEQTSIWGGNTGVLTEIDLLLDEYITSVRGYVGYFGDLFIVRSLQLITNRRLYGPYGKEEGTPFEFSALGGQIIGFHGRSGDYLHAIGVYFKVLA